MRLIRLPEGKTHRELLADFLKLSTLSSAGPGERKDVLERIPKTLACRYDGRVERVRELLQSTSIESTTLIQTEMYQTVLEGAEPYKCMREALPVFNTRAGTLRVPYGEAGTYAPEVAEGAEIPVDTQDYGYRDFVIHKYGTRPLISQELIDRSLYDVIALEVAKAGMRCENALNQAALSVILENSGNASDCGGTGATPIAKLAEAISANQVDGYQADTVILHPGAYGSLLSAFTALQTNMGNNITQTGVLGQILGMRTYVCSVVDTSPAYTWGWGTDNYVGALVIDSRNSGAIALEKDISVDRSVDTVRQVINAPVTIRFGVNYLAANATCRLVY